MVTELIKRVIKFLASTELAVVLFLAISLLAIPGTFSENRAIYASPLFLTLIGAFGLNLLFCTMRRLKTLPKPVLVLHCGVLVTLGGCIVTSYGFVATVNVYEGGTVNQAYRWDIEKDIPLGVDLVVKKINREFRPIPVKVGVLKGEKKEGLFVLKTGESFTLYQYRVQVDSLELTTKNLQLSVYEQGQLKGTCNTEKGSNLPVDFPYSFKLVAFQDPILKRLSVDLLLTSGSDLVAEGITEVNNPFIWNGLYFFNTQVDIDPEGLPYAGIQIVRDPGRPVVFAGFVMVGIGVILTYLRRFRRKGL